MPVFDGYKTGVYSIRNLVNGKQYVGSASVSFKRRWNFHRCLLNLGRHPNRHLQSAWLKYGEDSFVFVVLQRCSPTECVAAEQFWLDKTKAASPLHGYNITPTAGSPLGMRLTEEQKAKIGDYHRGKIVSAETGAKISAAKKGKKLPPRTAEHLARISAALKGKAKSPEHRAKLSAANTGKKASLETRRKLSEAQLRRYKS